MRRSRRACASTMALIVAQPEGMRQRAVRERRHVKRGCRHQAATDAAAPCLPQEMLLTYIILIFRYDLIVLFSAFTHIA